MTTIIVTDCPPRLRGDLTKWMLEVNTGVYIGKLSARVRDELWNRVCQNIKFGRATMVYRTNGEQGLDFRVHNSTWEPVDFDGLILMRKPTPSKGVVAEIPSLQDGFSKAAHRQKAHRINSARIRKRDCYVIVDLETTGMSPPHADILEMAALRVEDGKVKDEFHRLIRLDKPIPKETSELTGIQNDDMARAGVPLEKAMREFAAFVKSDMIVSHNTSFDKEFILSACRKIGLPALGNRFFDTLALARQRVQTAANYKLYTLAEELEVPVHSRHRALPDCYLTLALYEKLNKIEDNS